MSTHYMSPNRSRRATGLLFATFAAVVALVSSLFTVTTSREASAGLVPLPDTNTLWAWGDNYSGQLGLGDTTDRTTPTQVGTDANWASVSSGNYQTMGIKSDGTLWTWGSNWYGQLGLGDNTDRDIPTQVGTDANWASVSSGDSHTLAIKSDGTLWAWGYNASGQLGLGDNTDRDTPTQVGTDTNWASVTSGNYHTTAIKSDGTLWAWGYNASGQLGLGDITDRDIPTQVGIGTNWASVESGNGHIAAIKSDGTLWAWGDNYYGQLGLGDSGYGTERNTPTQVGTDTNWASVSGGKFHTTAIKSDGTLRAWGYNASGQLGLGDTLDRNTPTQVGTDTNWVSVSGGVSHTMAMKSDGTLWAWGHNSIGQLGLGDTTPRFTPTQVGTDTDWTSVGGGNDFTVALKVVQNPGSISGTVTAAATSAPIAGAEVFLLDTDTPTTVGSTVTDVNGAYEFNGLNPANYKVYVKANGYSNTYNGNVTAMASAPNIALNWNDALTADVEMDLITTIGGTVTGIGGTGVAGANVRIYDSANTLLYGATTDVDGNYQFTKIVWDLTDTYKVRVTTTSGVYAVTWNDNVATRNEAPAITLNQGANNIDIKMIASTTVGGIVTGTGGTGVAGANVRIYNSANTLLYGATTDAGGNYQFPATVWNMGDTYKIRVTTTGGGYAVTWNGNVATRNEAPAITLNQGANTINIAML